LFKLFQNVLRALEQSRSNARNNSVTAVTVSHLRADLANAIRLRDEAVSTSAEQERKAVLFHEEVRDLKLKLSRATQEKLKLERDSVRTINETVAGDFILLVAWFVLTVSFLFLFSFYQKQRATLSLARSLDSQKNHNNSSGSTEYYQRKNTELTSKVQSLTATVAELNRQKEELQRQLTRNMSQNRLENIRRGGGSSNNNNKRGL